METQTGRYHIAMKPTERRSKRVPIIELKPGEEGTINYVEVNNGCSDIVKVCGGVGHNICLKSASAELDLQGCERLAYVGDSQLQRLAESLSIPIQELQEIRELEKQVRATEKEEPSPQT